MTSLQKSKSNFLLVMSAFGVLVVGGTALALNTSVNYKTGASNISENMSDKLVKRGTSAFSPCKDLDKKYTYALLGNGVGEKEAPEPRRFGSPKPSAKPVNSPCTPLLVSDKMAEVHVGRRVLVKGVKRDGVFYATEMSSQNDDKVKASPSSNVKFLGPPVKTDPIYGTDPQN